MELTNEELLEKIQANEQSIIAISELLTKASEGLYELTDIVNKMLRVE